MTAAEQKENTLRLYRLAWRFPEKAPTPSCDVFGDSLYYRAAFMTYVPCMQSVSVTCRKTGVCTVTVDVDDEQLHIKGSAEYIESMLRSVPAELRPHVECDR